MAFLELQNLHRDFGTTKALDGIEISLGEGEFLSLLVIGRKRGARGAVIAGVR